MPDKVATTSSRFVHIPSQEKCSQPSTTTARISTILFPFSIVLATPQPLVTTSQKWKRSMKQVKTDALSHHCRCYQQ
ncbi:hypothetical protein M378DRAFT_165172 [Amanita muscaria Koide BX008]|uniref:Uncharacterized protein n=1 Tax=Amanita muscaria (strain Koide BX008) TaxID=946122 RepID=A0A0C2T8E0_AMAMK|nr:hypothetical protein M378DRAFT_165172 [Amanita muscaria Koide BX008]